MSKIVNGYCLAAVTRHDTSLRIAWQAADRLEKRSSPKALATMSWRSRTLPLVSVSRDNPYKVRHIVGDPGSVHGIGLQELAGRTKYEPPYVLLRQLRLLHHQRLAGELAVDSRGWQRCVVGDLIAAPDLLHHLADAQLRRVTLDRQQQLDHVRRNLPRPGLVGPVLRHQTVKAITPVAADPLPLRANGNPGTGAARDGMGARRAGAERSRLRGNWRMRNDVRDQAIAKQWDFRPKSVFGWLQGVDPPCSLA